jgi:hypothetical protein
MVLLLAACAPAPQPAPTPPAPVAPPPRPSGVLIGLTASELIARFGQPGFQVREGVGHKLQWSKGGCVLDAYLYPPASGQGQARATHIDTRRPSGVEIDQASCLGLLEAR